MNHTYSFFRSGAVITFSLIATACGGTDFQLQSNGNAQRFAGAHSTLTNQAATRTLDVCGDYPVVFGASDTGGSACVKIEFATATLSSLSLPATQVISGHATRTFDSTTGQQTITFSPDGTTAPIASSVWLHYDCFCPNYVDETIHGTITLTAVDAHRIAGSLNLTVVGAMGGTNSSSDAVQAHFDVSGS